MDRALARIRSVDNGNVQQFGIVRAGEQALEATILRGPYAGQTVSAHNMLIGKMETDKMFREGDRAYLVLNVRDGEIVSATAYDHYRLSIELVLVALFALVLVAFAGWDGIRAMLSFTFAVVVIWKLLLPGILAGWDPFVTSIAVVTLLTTVTLTLVGGLSVRAVVAILGAILGIALTAGLALLLLPPFNLHGAIQPFSETLLYSGFPDLNLTRMFLGAIFVGASGAVMDVAIDVSAAMYEVHLKRPDLSFGELVKSGFEVGRALTSTMVTTLLTAYAAGYMALLMVFLAKGTPPLQILNTNYVAAEVLKTVIGSFGLVTVAPFTAIVGGLLYTRHV
ncbi:MAG: YibE/F family protein [Anaerolineae bacterium]